MSISSPLMTRDEVAEFLRVSVTTVKRLDLPRIMIGTSVRYRREDIEAWLETHKIGGEVRQPFTKHVRLEPSSPREGEILEWLRRKPGKRPGR